MNDSLTIKQDEHGVFVVYDNGVRQHRWMTRAIAEKRVEHMRHMDAARKRLAASGKMPTIAVATMAARKRDPQIGMTVENGLFRIVRTVIRPNGRDCDVHVLAGPMPGFMAVDTLERFAAGEAL